MYKTIWKELLDAKTIITLAKEQYANQAGCLCQLYTQAKDRFEVVFQRGKQYMKLLEIGLRANLFERVYVMCIITTVITCEIDFNFE